MSATSAPSAPRESLLESARRRFFYGPAASFVTVAAAGLLAWLAWLALDWAVVRAVVQADYAACKLPDRGACWGFVAEKWRLIIFERVAPEDDQAPLLGDEAPARAAIGQLAHRVVGLRDGADHGPVEHEPAGPGEQRRNGDRDEAGARAVEEAPARAVQQAGRRRGERAGAVHRGARVTRALTAPIATATTRLSDR